MTDEDQAALLARGWDEAASGYERYFVPRFAPWVATAAEVVRDAALPPGPILVPCCGTFPELDALTAAHPGREIVGIDLSAGMIALARERAAGRPEVRLVHGDATALAATWPGTAAAVVSVFGLQQLPDPAAAITDWTRALRPGGRLSVVYWPPRTETEGPFALMEDVLAKATGDTGREQATWHQDLSAAAVSGGLAVGRDETVHHVIEHPGAAAYWTAMTVDGPMRRMMMARGADFEAAASADFLRRAPAGPWRHRPGAGLIEGRRT
ncbi:class I SAM-dependent methyltransferase [Phytomonospora endophytica]|uniref:SAM-dependent methyltransferase n=1 Tax=Phytomonospora endophytica TaxID=714109 RepID=A0A841FF90_9ACTN|nr:class I SAM-dependent methyltransferase [Phytomonospora endophytica]MBB6034936.1 SAM-dependent methyltransferase [Phytomonospora endophytica]GIG70638.1 hypothetical protein Pen01_69330 [Phytomonospora endophytica]